MRSHVAEAVSPRRSGDVMENRMAMAANTALLTGAHFTRPIIFHEMGISYRSRIIRLASLWDFIQLHNFFCEAEYIYMTRAAARNSHLPHARVILVIYPSYTSSPPQGTDTTSCTNHPDAPGTPCTRPLVAGVHWLLGAADVTSSSGSSLSHVCFMHIAIPAWCGLLVSAAFLCIVRVCVSAVV